MEYLKPMHVHMDEEPDERIRTFKKFIISEVNDAADNYEYEISEIDYAVLDLVKMYDDQTEEELRIKVYYTLLSQYYLELQNIKILYLDCIGDCELKEYILLIMDTVFKEGEKVGNIDAINRYYK